MFTLIALALTWNREPAPTPEDLAREDELYEWMRGI
jgi:hypothetical protein